ncbi:hypothetical protein OHB26_00975 [Nocardia sp. NBC_01503]|uniref:hypothetical protein n=1 Tax=Nocardia sp. NBC_01503 TaxID=2975997 RepID=UPI002E7AE5F7|nr:hypothetical protein [Nocardia sp. NBC_01503]WTL32866.1 hypothetical protein OHB26_00975 [Nocardia sp. NBC_01503]
MTASTATRPRLIAGMSPLRRAYEADGIVTLASGILIAALSGVLDTALGLSTELLLGVGAFFILYAAGVLVIATRREIPRRPAAFVAGLNAVWAVDSVITLEAGWLEPTTLGIAGILFIAAFTAAMAAVQTYALRATR